MKDIKEFALAFKAMRDWFGRYLKSKQTSPQSITPPPWA